MIGNREAPRKLYETIIYAASGTELCRFIGTVDLDFIDDKMYIETEDGKKHIIAFTPSAVIVVNPTDKVRKVD